MCGDGLDACRCRGHCSSPSYILRILHVSYDVFYNLFYMYFKLDNDLDKKLDSYTNMHFAIQVVLFLSKLPDETSANRKLASQIVQTWVGFFSDWLPNFEVLS